MHIISLCFTVVPTIQIGPAQAVTMQLPSTSSPAEDVISLPLDPEVLELTPSTSSGKGKAVCGKGKKRTYSSTNTAPDYAEAQGDSVSDNYYPAYLYQTPPSKLTMDHLRKHALITKKERNKAQINFFQIATGLLGPMKEALIAMASSSDKKNSPNSSGDHPYTSQNVTD